MRKVCGGIALALVLAAPAIGAPKYSDWGEPTNLGCTVNSAFADQGAAITKDGLSLYFGSNRGANGGAPGSNVAFDLYVTQRTSLDAPWGTPLPLAINSPMNDNVPSLSRDDHWLFFNSGRPGGFGDIDLWASYRQHVHDDLAWEAPVNLGPQVNTAGFDAGAGYFENERGAPLLYFNRADSQATQTTTSNIYVATLQDDGTFGNVQPVIELNTAQSEQRPSIRHDGLEIFFFSNRIGSTVDSAGALTFDIWTATRESLSDPWGTPVKLNNKINTAVADITPQISPDGLTLFFASSRPGGCGGVDLYMTTRTKLKGGDR